jgi:hypothetical protein
LLQFAKKKRRRSDSGSEVDMEFTPPQSPRDDSEKRRSGRNTNKRKKYVDDVDLNLSEEEHVPQNQDGLAKDSNGKAEKNGLREASVAPSEISKGFEDTQSSMTLDASESQSGPNYAFIVSKYYFTFQNRKHIFFLLSGSHSRGYYDRTDYLSHENGDSRTRK